MGDAATIPTPMRSTGEIGPEILAWSSPRLAKHVRKDDNVNARVQPSSSLDQRRALRNMTADDADSSDADSEASGTPCAPEELEQNIEDMHIVHSSWEAESKRESQFRKGRSTNLCGQGSQDDQMLAKKEGRLLPHEPQHRIAVDVTEMLLPDAWLLESGAHAIVHRGPAGVNAIVVQPEWPTSGAC